MNWRIFFCAFAIVAVLALIAFYTMICFVGFSSPPRGLLERNEWPEPFATIFPDQENVTAFGLRQFLDNQIVFGIYNHADSIDQLIAKHNLQPTESTHPCARILFASMPATWPKWTNSDDDRWYATKDFGTVHLEGQDLFLVVTNDRINRTLIYYNLIF